MAEPGVLVGLYDLVLWYTQRTERFPKSLRVTLGDRIDNKLLDMLELAVRARYARDPRKLLWSLNTELDFMMFRDFGLMKPGKQAEAKIPKHPGVRRWRKM